MNLQKNSIVLNFYTTDFGICVKIDATTPRQGRFLVKEKHLMLLVMMMSFFRVGVGDFKYDLHRGMVPKANKY